MKQQSQRQDTVGSDYLVIMKRKWDTIGSWKHELVPDMYLRSLHRVLAPRVVYFDKVGPIEYIVQDPEELQCLTNEEIYPKCKVNFNQGMTTCRIIRINSLTIVKTHFLKTPRQLLCTVKFSLIYSYMCLIWLILTRHFIAIIKTMRIYSSLNMKNYSLDFITIRE